MQRYPLVGLVLAAPARGFDRADDRLALGRRLKSIAGVAAVAAFGMALIGDRFLAALCGRRRCSADRTQRDRPGRQRHELATRRHRARAVFSAVHAEILPETRRRPAEVRWLGPSMRRNAPRRLRFLTLGPA